MRVAPTQPQQNRSFPLISTIASYLVRLYLSPAKSIKQINYATL
jgi:hypothetical protein